MLADSALHDSEKEYYVALVAYYSGKTNETRGKLAALAEAPGLSSAQLQRLAALCDEQKLFAERVKILNRIASGGYGEWTRWGALAEPVNTHVKSDPGWKKTDPKRVLGIVRFDRVLGLSQSETLTRCILYGSSRLQRPVQSFGSSPRGLAQGHPASCASTRTVSE